MIAQIFGYMNLQEVEGYFDKVFEKHELMREFISEVDKGEFSQNERIENGQKW